jgi:hypothetical protein
VGISQELINYCSPSSSSRITIGELDGGNKNTNRPRRKEEEMKVKEVLVGVDKKTGKLLIDNTGSYFVYREKNKLHEIHENFELKKALIIIT